MEKERPSVIIELDPILQDYLYHEFGKTTDEGVCINCKHDIGLFIQAMITLSDRPPKQELKDYPIRIYLPVQEWNHHILRENFIYVPVWKQDLIRKYVEASFRLKQREYFVTGYEKGFGQDMIVKSFLDTYNIKHNQCNYDAVKKYDYRNRKRTIKEVRQAIQLSIFD